MYEDFYPYIPGSLDVRQRRRKRWLRRVGYTFGACIVFSSGFLLGLAWYEPIPAPPQTALQYPHPFEASNTSPVESSTSLAELAAPSLAPQPIPPYGPASHATSAVETDIDMDAEADTEQTVTKTDASPLSSVVLDSDTEVPPHLEEDQPQVERDAEVISQPHTPTPDKQAASPRPYLVQVGAYRHEANARGIVAKLRDKGYHPFVRRVEDRQNRVLHRVFLDHAKDKSQAQAAAKAFEETEKMEAVVMLANHGFSQDDQEARSR